jgi:proline iminopeptidase
MKVTTSWKFVLISVIPLLFYSCSGKNDTAEGMSLWPEIEPFQSGFLKVSDIHDIYYELCGNPEGKPVFVIHGGPGAGCSPYMRRFFDPDKFLIVLHDQRGCGRSKPIAELKENTTQNLVEDIEGLRKDLDLDKIILFGGSWGSTLSLAYAETYPEHVCGLLLRGVFLGTKEESNNIVTNVIPKFFPESYETMVEAVPVDTSGYSADTWLRLLQSENHADRVKYAKIMSRYEFKACGLHMEDELLDEYYGSDDNIEHIHTMALMEMHYVANNCFLEEGQLLKDVHRIQHIPITIVNGRYDMVCPPYTAYKLHKKLPGSKLIIVEVAGHLQNEEPIETELLKAMHDFEKL